MSKSPFLNETSAFMAVRRYPLNQVPPVILQQNTAQMGRDEVVACAGFHVLHGLPSQGPRL